MENSLNANPVLDAAAPEEPKKKKFQFKEFISGPLFKQSLKANKTIWIVLTLGLVFLLGIINITMGSKQIFNNIDMDAVNRYVNDENMQWLQVLGLLETMGFSLSRIQVMSQLDMNSVLSDLIYKIAGVLLPMIYIIIVSNKLIASQVDNGSLAYVLSTPTNRKKVVRTQYLFLILSLIVMYIVVTLFSILTEWIGYREKALPLRIILYCFGSFCCMVGMSGVTFGASAFFNRSKNSLALGGGFCVFSFLCTILGLFSNKVFVSVGVGVESMKVFNYMSIITLFDTESMSSFAKVVCHYDPDAVISYDWIYKSIIMLAIGGVLSYLGGRRFVRKDLPL